MKIILASLVFGSLVVGTALAQTSATSQSSAAASNDTSVSADKSGAQVGSKPRRTQRQTPPSPRAVGKARQRATCSLALPSVLTLEGSRSRPRGPSPELSLLAPAPVEE